MSFLQVTDNSENVFNLELGELSDLDQAQKEIVSKNMINHLRRLASERDDYSEVSSPLLLHLNVGLVNLAQLSVH